MLHDLSVDALTLSWMPNLIKAQAIMDGGVRLAVRQETALRGAEPACAKSCSGCCASRPVSTTAVEMAGVLWYLGRVGSGPAREALGQFSAPDDGTGACPFLVEDVCAAYPMRFLSCRQLVVFGRACAVDEDPVRLRRADVLTPLRLHAFKAYVLMLPYLGVQTLPSGILELEALIGGFLKPVNSYRTADPAAILLDVERGQAREPRKAA